MATIVRTRRDGSVVDLANAVRLCLARRPSCPECGRPTFGLLEGWRRHVHGDGLWTEAGRVRYRCADHRACVPGDPYRGSQSRPPRYSLTVDGRVFEGERFAEIIEAMREHGYGDADISQAGSVAVESSRGGRLTTASRHDP